MGPLYEPGREEDFRHSPLVSQLCGCDCRTKQSPNQPDYSGDEESKDHEWSQEDQDDPDPRRSQISDVAAHGGCRIAMQPAAQQSHIAVDRNLLVDTHIACEGGDIAVNTAVLVDDDAAAEGRHVACCVAFDVDAATEAGYVAHFLVRANADVVPESRAIFALVAKGKTGHGQHRKQPGETPKRWETHETLHSRSGLMDSVPRIIPQGTRNRQRAGVAHGITARSDSNHA